MPGDTHYRDNSLFDPRMQLNFKILHNKFLKAKECVRKLVKLGITLANKLLSATANSLTVNAYTSIIVNYCKAIQIAQVHWITRTQIQADSQGGTISFLNYTRKGKVGHIWQALQHQ